MTSVQLPFGHSSIPLQLPDHVAFGTLEPRALPPVSDPQRAILDALRNPIGAPPLCEIVKPGESVAILVNDVTRLVHSEVFLPVLIGELNRAGVPDQDIFIVFALGIHRSQTADEQRAIVGDEIARRIKLYDHDCFDRGNLVHTGTTSRGNEVFINRRVWEADRVILTGEIIYHLIAGYSGGRKSLVPGVAGAETVTLNHKLILDPRCRCGVLDGNPAHEDLLEACALSEPDFLLNVVLNPRGQLLRVVCGHYDFAHRAGCETVDQLYGAPLAELYDVVLASAGGYPVDIDLRQAHKGMENAFHALKPGGTLIYFAECPDGSGSRAFEEWAARYSSSEEMAEALRENFVVGGHKAYWMAKLGEQARIFLVSRLPELFVRRCHVIPASSPDEAVREAFSAEAGKLRVALMPYANFTLPRTTGRSLRRSA
ncbi:MAG: nickel-dependent lactate racemase [Terriglobia bacterium]